MRAFQIIPALATLYTHYASVLAQNDTVPTPTLTHVLTAHVYLGDLVGPIPVYGGAQVLEPITSGDISGSALNATISSGGAAAIGVYANQTVHRPFVELWGTTDDHVPFFVQVNGIGGVKGQFASVVSMKRSFIQWQWTELSGQTISIGGRYQYLENLFILASLSDNDANPPTEATIEAWVVTQSA